MNWHKDAQNRVVARQLRKWRFFDLPPAPATRALNQPPVANSTQQPDRRFNIDTEPVRQFLDVGCLAVQLARLAEQPIPAQRYLGLCDGDIAQQRRDYPDYEFIKSPPNRAGMWGRFDRVFAYADVDFDALAQATVPAGHLALLVLRDEYSARELKHQLAPHFNFIEMRCVCPPEFYKTTDGPLALSAAANHYLRSDPDTGTFILARARRKWDSA